MFNVCKIKFLIAAILSVAVTSAFSAPPEWVEGQLIVKPRAGLSAEQFEKILGKAKGQSVKHLQQINARVIEVPPQALEAVSRALSNNPNIDFVERNPLVPPSAFTPNDPRFPDQWQLSKIQAPAAWDTATGNGITVAILDSGVEGSHPDLAGSMVPGWNVVSNNSNTSAMSVHGTAVAGAIAATGNNATGVASVVWNAGIMPIRISNRTDGWAEGSDMVEGVLWAADHGADVVNISYDFGNGFAALNEAAQYLRNKGGLVVMAAGNNNTDYGFSDNPYIIHVSATTSTDAKASFSNFGDFVDVSAPGKGVLTVWQNGGYAWGDGTSFSSPIAAGVIALVKAANPGLSPVEVETILKDSADDLGSNGWDKYFGYGRVNAAAAVQMATQTTLSDTQSPDVQVTSPAYNSTVSGNVIVDVDASDDTGVTGVALYANGQYVGYDTTAPYQFSWDSSSVADGDVTLTAYAFDAANNAGISAGVTVIVYNQLDNVDTTAPSVVIRSPAASSNDISGTVIISVDAFDDTGVTDVVLYVNGKISGTDSTAPYEFNWDSTQVADGSVQFVAKAYDAANNVGTSSIVTVNVNNQPDAVDVTAPSVAVISPASRAEVDGTVGISVGATDDVGVTQLSIDIDGSILCSSADTQSLDCNWNTRKLDGTHTITAIASDAAGNTSASSILVSIASNSSKGSPGQGKGRNK